MRTPGMRDRFKQLGEDVMVDSDLNGTTMTAGVPVRWMFYDSSSIG